MEKKKYGRFGREIYEKENGEWFWKEDDTSILIDKSCPKCHLFPLKYEVDPCLGLLPGVEHACCGHGIHNGYILFNNGKRVILKDFEIK